MSAVAEKLLTAEEYARVASEIDGRTELVRGRMIVHATGTYRTWLLVHANHWDSS